MNANAAAPEHVVVITSLLEAEHVERMRIAGGSGVDIVYMPELMPPARYQGDHNGRPEFRRSPEQEARFRAALGRATILWDFPPKTDDGHRGLSLAPKVRWVQTTSSGVGRSVADLGLADTDLLVTTARGVHAEALAEFVFLALLAHAKDLPRLQRDQRAHRWERYCCGELAGKTLVVVGAGKVGAQSGRIARAFGMRAIGVVNNASPSRAAELGLDEVVGPDALRAALARADAVVLATPHTPHTERLIDAALIAAMKPGVVLVNIARGAVIDEPALIDALRRRHVGFAALDVAAIEPLPADSPLWDMDNVLVSPHSASTAPSENRKITDIFCHNLRCWLDGRRGEMLNVLDKKRMY